jgi:hypothetical protein
MLYAVGFDRIGVVASDLYFVDPDPAEGQEGAEQGVRVEVRFVERGEPRGSMYSAWPITVGRPIWRADLLESVANPGSLDRAHHHPRILGDGWEPGYRVYVEEMSADPVGWVGKRLTDLQGLLEEAGVEPREVGATDAAELRAVVPEIVAAVHRMLDRVREGELAQPPADAQESARLSWL